MRSLRYLPVVLGLLGCEPPYRDALRAGDEQARSNPVAAASFYEKAVELGAVAQGHLKLAELAERQQHWDEAAQHYAEAQKALPKEPSLAHAHARVLLEQGRRPQAFAVLQAALGRFPDDGFSVLMLGALATDAEQVAVADNALQAHPQGGLEGELVAQAISARKGAARIKVLPSKGTPPLLPANLLFQLAAVLEGNGRPGLSAELLSAGTQKYPKEEFLWFPLLRSQATLNDVPGALATIEKLPTDVRFSAEGLMLQARVHLTAGDRAAAIGAIQRAVRALPETATERRVSAQLLLGQTLFDAGRPKDAINTFAAVLAANPNQVTALLGKAGAELSLGAAPTAQQTTAQAVKLEPENDAARKLHVASLLGTKDFAAAKAAADDYIALTPERATAWALRAKAVVEQAKALDAANPERKSLLLLARTDLRKALELEPGEPTLLTSWLSLEQELVGFPQNLVPVRAWLTEQHRWAGLVQLASYCNAKADPKTATEMFRAATAVAPEEPQVWRVYAVHLETTGGLTEALEAQSKLLAHDPRDEAALRDVARLQRKLNQPELAVATYRQWLTVNPDAVLALNNLAAILGSSPATLNEAISLAERAHQLAPASPAIADTLGWLLFTRNQDGDRARAVELLTAASTGMDNPVHHLHLAEALLATSNRDEAQRALDRALAHPAFDDRTRAQTLRSQLVR